MKTRDPRFTRLNIASAFLVLVVTIYFALLNYPGGVTHLVIDANSDALGKSQIFFNENENYSENATATFPLTSGKNTITFALSTAKSPLRWDPIDNDSGFSVTSMKITLFGLEIPSNIKIEKLSNIEMIVGTFPNLTFDTVKKSNDPQTLVTFSAGRISLLQSVGLLFFAILGSALITLFLTKGHLILGELDKFPLYRKWASRKSSIFQVNGREILTLIIIAAILNTYFLSTLSLSIDDEGGALRTNPEIWISQGRWATYLVERFLFPQPAIPFAPYLFMCICLGLSYVLTLRLHQVQTSWKTYLTYPIYCAFPTWWFIEEFSSNVPAAALGWLLITLSVLEGLKTANSSSGHIKSRPFQRLFLGVCISFAIACYQSLILLYASLALGAVVMVSLGQSDKGYTLKDTIRILSSVAINLILGVIFYILINKLSLKITNQQSAYLSNFIKLNELITHPITVTVSVIKEMITIYSGSSARFGASIYTTIPIVTLSSLLIWFKGNRPFLQITLWIALLFSPFALHFMAGPENMPIRTMLTISYVVWLMAFIIIHQQSKIINLVGVVLATGLIVQILNVSSQYIATATITQAHDRALAADIYSKIGDLSPDFDRNISTTIDVYGHKRFRSVYASGWTSTMDASFFDWDNGNLSRMLSYMHVMGYQNLTAPTIEERTANIPLFTKMPVWPARGSVQKINDQYLIKLSNDADPWHIAHD